MNPSLSLKAVLRASCGFVAVIVLALLSLWAVDRMRDPAAIRNAVIQAFAEQRLGDEAGIERFGRHRTSHFSECVGLSTAILPEASNALWFTLASPALLWQPPKSICRSLHDEAAGQPQPHFDYSRYWHGYRLVTETVLSLLPYADLQEFCSLLLLLAALGVVAASLRAGPWTIRSFLFGGLALAALAVTVDWPGLSRTPTHAISVATLLLCWAFATLPRAPERDGLDRALPAAFVMGAIYNFFDFLYNPDLLAFVLGWSFLMRAVLSRRGPAWPALLGAVAVQIVAVAGYMAMWAVKWGLVRFGGDLLGQRTFMPTQDFNRWIAGGEEAYVPFRATYALLVEAARMPLGPWPLAACLVVLGALLVLAVRRGRGAAVLAAMALVLFPLFTLELKANHTLMHAAFTFRFISFAVVLTTMGAALVLGREEHGMGDHRSPILET